VIISPKMNRKTHHTILPTQQSTIEFTPDKQTNQTLLIESIIYIISSLCFC